jgi:hypothetical protein
VLNDKIKEKKYIFKKAKKHNLIEMSWYFFFPDYSDFWTKIRYIDHSKMNGTHNLALNFKMSLTTVH